MRLAARLLAGLALLVSATIGALVVTAGPAAASCAEPSADLLETSDVAFLGIVSDRRERGDDLIATVRTDSVYKGEVTRRVDVVSSDREDQVQAGLTDRLIVFGTLVDSEVHATQCTVLMGPGKAYAKALADLGPGTKPAPGYTRADRGTLGLTYDQFSAGRAVLGVLGLAGLAYFAFLFWRRRRRMT